MLPDQIEEIDHREKIRALIRDHGDVYGIENSIKITHLIFVEQLYKFYLENRRPFDLEKLEIEKMSEVGFYNSIGEMNQT